MSKESSQLNEVRSTPSSSKYFWKKKTVISFILSVLVVFIHASSFSQYSNRAIENLPASIYFFRQMFQKSLPLIAVPLFFLISGAVFFRNYDNSSFLIKLKNRLKTLGIPYLIWNVLNMLFAIITSYTFISSFFLGRQKFVLTFSNIFLSIFHYKSNLPFWFIFALICFIAISPIIDVIISSKFIGISAIITLIVLQYFNIGIPESFILNQDAIIYYLIGCFVGKHFFHIFQTQASSKASLLAGIFFALSIGFLLFKSYDIIPDIPALNTIVLIIAIVSFWIVSDLFIDRIQVRPYMEYSFFIYAMHVNVQAIIIKLLFLFGPKKPFMAVISFFGTTILTIIAITLFTAFIKKYIPKLYTVLSGNR